MHNIIDWKRVAKSLLDSSQDHIKSAEESFKGGDNESGVSLITAGLVAADISMAILKGLGLENSE